MENKLIIFPIVGLLIIAMAVAQTSQDISVSAEIPTFVSVVFNYDSVNFGTVNPGFTHHPAPDQALGRYNVTVATNVDVSVIVQRSPWIPNDVLVLGFACGDPLPLVPAYTVTTTSQVVDTLSPGEYTHYHGYWLTVPIDTPPGNYSTTVSITYEPA